MKKKNRAGLLQNADLRIFGNRSGNCDFIIIKCPFFFFQTSIYKVPWLSPCTINKIDRDMLRRGVTIPSSWTYRGTSATLTLGGVGTMLPLTFELYCGLGGVTIVYTLNSLFWYIYKNENLIIIYFQCLFWSWDAMSPIPPPPLTIHIHIHVW